jgi:hypothetical protein
MVRGIEPAVTSKIITELKDHGTPLPRGMEPLNSVYGSLAIAKAMPNGSDLSKSGYWPAERARDDVVDPDLVEGLGNIVFGCVSGDLNHQGPGGDQNGHGWRFLFLDSIAVLAATRPHHADDTDLPGGEGGGGEHERRGGRDL